MKYSTLVNFMFYKLTNKNKIYFKYALTFSQ